MSFTLEVSPLDGSSSSEHPGLVHLIIDVSDDGHTPSPPSFAQQPVSLAYPWWLGAWEGQYPMAQTQMGGEGLVLAPCNATYSSGTAYSAAAGCESVNRRTEDTSPKPERKWEGPMQGPAESAKRQSSPKGQSPLVRAASSAREVLRNRVRSRLPTPHPSTRRKDTGTASSSSPKATVRTQQPTVAWQPRVAQLAPKQVRKMPAENTGRPLWSSNFSGANAPHKADPVARPALPPLRKMAPPQVSIEPTAGEIPKAHVTLDFSEPVLTFSFS